MRTAFFRAIADGVGAACLLAAAACGTGTDLNQLVNEQLVDGGAAGGGGSGGGSSFQDPFAGAPAYASQTGQSSHNPGQSCMQGGCHGGEAPSFLIGGTIYADYKGMTPAAGVEVRIVDSAGHAASTHTGPNGNFHIPSGSANGVTFPAIVGARSGTTTRPMITTLTSSMGSCGQTHCHVPGGGPVSGTGNYYPIHVP
jgi:hypothetical protein